MTGSARAAQRRVVPRHPNPAAIAPISRSGPTTPAIEPATTHRAMFRSVVPGSRSIHVACASPTNAPDAGQNRHVAASIMPKLGAAANAAIANAKATPPASTMRRR